jgi:hypothetical protein
MLLLRQCKNSLLSGPSDGFDVKRVSRLSPVKKHKYLEFTGSCDILHLYYIVR